jgi:hypothetical protein
MNPDQQGILSVVPATAVLDPLLQPYACGHHRISDAEVIDLGIMVRAVAAARLPG